MPFVRYHFIRVPLGPVPEMDAALAKQIREGAMRHEEGRLSNQQGVAVGNEIILIACYTPTERRDS